MPITSRNSTVVHGASLPRELELLVKSGLTPAQALTAATESTAAVFRLNDRGRVAPDKRADLGLLVMKSRFLPRVLGILLVIAGVALVAHSIISLLLDGRRIILYELVTMVARAAGEFPIMLWLLIKGPDAHQLRRPLAGEVRDAASS